MSLLSKNQWDGLATEFAQSLTKPLMRFLWGWAKKMIPLFVILAVAFSLSVSLYQVFQGWRDNQVKLFVGPDGSSSSDQAGLVEKELKQTRSFWKPNYYVKQTLRTDGSVRILRRVNEDTEGEVIGFATEGMELDDSTNIRTLVPMEWCYLHFLVNTSSLKQELGVSLSGDRFKRADDKTTDEKSQAAASSLDAIKPYKFSEWAQQARRKLHEESESTSGQKLQAGHELEGGLKVYLGPKGSGTRQLAEVVLNKANIPLTIGDELEIDDFEEMAAALKKGTIHGAFFLGPPESESGIIEQIAKSNTCTLIELDQADKFSKVNPFLFADEIPAYAYSFGGADKRLDSIKTLKVRRVVVVSNSMDSGDAFRLANHIRAALPKQSTESFAEASGAGLELNYPLHPGLSLDQHAIPGLAWLSRNVSWFVPLLVAMALSFASELWTHVADWLNRHGADAQSSVNSYEGIERLTDMLLDELLDAEIALVTSGTCPAKSDLSAWKRQIDRIYLRISQASQSKILSRNETDGLLAGVAKLNDVLEFIRKPPIEFGAVSAGLSEPAANGAKPTSQPLN